jgi:HEAT repeat protein
VARLTVLLLLLAAVIGGAVWYYEAFPRRAVPDPSGPEPSRVDESWLEALSSPNPREAEAAAGHVQRLGVRALPLVSATLRNAGADAEHRKAALKACGILGRRAAPLVPDVAATLSDPELTAEAAVALSFMGPGAFPPLSDASSSDDPVVRREALRSLGKLKERAPLEGRLVLPLLLDGMSDQDAGVRAVAATYLGIIHEQPEESVPVLIESLRDEDVEVRRAAATALGSFGDQAQEAIPALRHASSDRDPDVAREAGRALVRLLGKH